MPYITQWIEPELFLKHKGVYVYHCYKDEDWNQEALLFWYTTDEDEDEEYQFDVRKLPVPPSVDKKDHTAIIRHAIDHNLLKGPTEKSLS